MGYFADNVLDEIEKQDTIYLDNSNEVSNIETENKNENKKENKKKMKIKKIKKIKPKI